MSSECSDSGSPPEVRGTLPLSSPFRPPFFSLHPHTSFCFFLLQSRIRRRGLRRPAAAPQSPARQQSSSRCRRPPSPPPPFPPPGLICLPRARPTMRPTGFGVKPPLPPSTTTTSSYRISTARLPIVPPLSNVNQRCKQQPLHLPVLHRHKEVCTRRLAARRSSFGRQRANPAAAAISASKRQT